MATKDAALAVRSTSDGAMSATFTSAEIRLKAAPMEGYAVEVMVPAKAGLSDVTLDVFVWGATATGVTSDSAVLGQTPIQLVDTTVVGQHLIPFHLPVNYTFIKVRLEVGGTSVDFSTVLAYIVKNLGTTWTRAVHFD